MTAEPNTRILRHMGMRMMGCCSFFFTAVLVAVTGCTSENVGTGTADALPTGARSAQLADATDACTRALPSKRIASASVTTVGEVRALKGGPPGSRIFPSAFPASTPDAVAYYCYSDEGAQSYEAFAVRDTEAILGVRLGGLGEVPFGPPILP